VTFFVKKRGKTYRLEGRHGERLRRGTGERGRLRLSLGTMNDDAALWGEIDWASREINRLTLKRRKRILLPIHQELFFALETERDRRQPTPEERVLLNPGTGNRSLARDSMSERWRLADALASSVHTLTVSGIRTRWISSRAAPRRTMSRSCWVTR
jgi:hypothetical protein